MGIVKVYKMWFEDGTEKDYAPGLEVLYAQLEDGTVLKCVRKYSSTFNLKSNKWSTVLEMPENVEFIGKYRTE